MVDSSMGGVEEVLGMWKRACSSSFLYGPRERMNWWGLVWVRCRGGREFMWVRRVWMSHCCEDVR